ncbi:MAG: transcriptional regulator [Robiginitomaculum sp.]|nr:MAG: transcriptional regulator [Robiginitomaculum sp.]
MTKLIEAQAKVLADEPVDIYAAYPFDEFVHKHGTTKRRGIFGYFVHYFGRLIVGGDYAEGATLPNEPDLVAKYGISRTVIREAMKCLAGKGLVEIRTRIGTSVRPRKSWHHLDPDVVVWYYETGPSLEIMRSIKDLRIVLEPAAAVRAVERASSADIADIRDAFTIMENSIGDHEANADADLAFHTAIFSATKNMIYSQLIDLIAVAIYANRVISTPEAVVEGQKRSLPYHRDVLVAIEARNATEAAAASQRLVESWRNEMYDF